MLDQKLVEELKNAPLLLLTIKDQETIDYFNSLIPYSTGFEIECDRAENYNAQAFTAIPDIMDVNSDSYEQRYRIPNGIRGMICLYHISQQLKVHSLLNPLSSVHYHIDCTDYWKEICAIANGEDKKKHEEYILSELDTWLKGDTATMRNSGYWYKLNSLQTVEFRLGEMTFDYRILLKRIIHCNAIVTKFKIELPNFRIPEYTLPNAKVILEYNRTTSLASNKIKVLNSKLVTLRKEIESKESKEIKSTEEVIITRNRNHKI